MCWAYYVLDLHLAYLAEWILRHHVSQGHRIIYYSPFLMAIGFFSFSFSLFTWSDKDRRLDHRRLICCSYFGVRNYTCLCG